MHTRYKAASTLNWHTLCSGPPGALGASDNTVAILASISVYEYFLLLALLTATEVTHATHITSILNS